MRKQTKRSARDKRNCLMFLLSDDLVRTTFSNQAIAKITGIELEFIQKVRSEIEYQLKKIR